MIYLGLNISKLNCNKRMPRRITKTAHEEYVQSFESVDLAIEKIFMDLYGKPKSDEHIVCGVGQPYSFMSVGEIKKLLKENKSVAFHNISFLGTVIEKIDNTV